MNAIARLETDRAEWLDWRRRGIGASDMSAILGLSRHRTALDVYLDKIGEGPEDSPNIPMRAGTFLEPFIGELFAEATGDPIVEVQRRAMHPACPVFRATLDGITASGRVVELKSVETPEGLGEPGSDDVRDEWLVQAHHQMLASLRDEVMFGVLVGKREFRLYEVKRSTVLVDTIYEAGRKFWERVERREPPEPTLPADARNVAGMFRPDGSEVELPDADELVFAYESARQAKRDAEEAFDTAKARLIQALGTHSVGLLPDGRRVKRTDVEVKERTQIVKAHTQTRITIQKARSQ